MKRVIVKITAPKGKTKKLRKSLNFLTQSIIDHSTINQTKMFIVFTDRPHYDLDHIIYERIEKAVATVKKSTVEYIVNSNSNTIS